jgi:two-component system, NtrC family, response regulator HydG
VIEVRIPSLRERREDVMLLAETFVRRFAAKNQRTLKGFTDAARSTLENYAFPGNVRELEHVIERAVVLCRGELIDDGDLPESVRKGPTGSASQIVIGIGTPMEEVERRVILETLRHTRGDKNLAARLLGIAARTIYRKLAAEEEAKEKEQAPAPQKPG